MSESPIERLLAAIDSLDVEAVMALLAPEARLLATDGRRAEGTHQVRELVTASFAELRSTTHEITAQWHVDDAWIAEIDRPASPTSASTARTNTRSASMTPARSGGRW